ncbi:hypothetical protein D3C71_1819820 [compost metagenome]
MSERRPPRIRALKLKVRTNIRLGTSEKPSRVMPVPACTASISSRARSVCCGWLSLKRWLSWWARCG